MAASRETDKSSVRLVVFDLDGTLIDSRRDLADAANALIVERGGAPLAVDEITAMVGEGAAMLVRRVMTAARLEGELDVALARYLELYDERLLRHTRLYEGTAEALDALARRALLAVLTNKPQRPTQTILDGLGIAPFFQSIVGGDTAHGRKPDPAGLNWLIWAAGATPGDTTMVGDSAVDLKTARAAGTRVCLVRYGFGFPTAEPLLDGSEKIAGAPRDLIELLTTGG